MDNRHLESTSSIACCGAVQAAIECYELEFGDTWIGRLNKVAVRGQDAADVVDTYMLFGDALWKDHRNEAVEHFLVGLVKSAEITIDAFIQTGMHLFWKLHAIDQAERDGLQTHADKWFVRQFNGQEVQCVLSVLLWPFTVARQFVFDARHTPDKNVNAMTRLFSRHFTVSPHMGRPPELRSIQPDIEAVSATNAGIDPLRATDCSEPMT